MFGRCLIWSSIFHLIILWGIGFCLPPAIPGGNHPIALQFSPGASWGKEENDHLETEEKVNSTGEEKKAEVDQEKEVPEQILPAEKANPVAVKESANQGLQTTSEEKPHLTKEPPVSAEAEKSMEGRPPVPVNNGAQSAPAKEVTSQSLVSSSQILPPPPSGDTPAPEGEEDSGEEGIEQRPSAWSERRNGAETLLEVAEGVGQEDPGAQDEGNTPAPPGGTPKSAGHDGEPDHLPVLVTQTTPVYPLIARRRGWEGTVTLQLQLEEDGEVTAVEVLQSSGYDVLDQTAVKTIDSWVYEPAYRDGKPIAYQMQVKITFKLAE